MPLFPTGSRDSQGASDDQSQDRRPSTYSIGGESYGHSVHSSDDRPASSVNRPTTGQSGQSIAPSYSSVRSGGSVGIVPGQLPGQSGMDGYFQQSTWSASTSESDAQSVADRPRTGASNASQAGQSSQRQAQPQTGSSNLGYGGTAPVQQRSIPQTFAALDLDTNSWSQFRIYADANGLPGWHILSGNTWVPTNLDPTNSRRFSQQQWQ